MDKTLLRARGHRTALITALAELDRRVTVEHYEMTEQDLTEHRRLESELTNVNAVITERETKYARERAQGAVANGAESPGYVVPGNQEAIFDVDPTERPLRPSRLALPPGAKQYAQMFGSPSGKTGGFESREEFFRTVHSGRADPRLSAAHFEGIPSSGGFAVPEQFAADLLDDSLETEIVRPRADVQPMTSDSKKVAMWDGLDHSTGALYGGFTAQWLAEGAALTEKTAKLRLINLNAKKMALLAQVSNEMIMDGGTFEGALVSAMVKAMGWHLDYYFLRGTGAGQPLGVLGDPALVTVAKDASQPADTVSYNNLAGMFSRMHPALLGDAIWIANPTTIPQLLQLVVKITNVAGTENVGGSHIPVVTESNGVFRILTKPVVFTEKLPALGDVGDILFVNFSQYAVGLRKEVSIDKSIHVGFQIDTSHYRGILRVDGQGKWNKPVTPKAGSTLSWAVVLEAR